MSLASQKNRCDVIEACCIDAVANAAALHHARSVNLPSQLRFGHNIDMDDTLEENEESKEAPLSLLRDVNALKLSDVLPQQVNRQPDRPMEGALLRPSKWDHVANHIRLLAFAASVLSPDSTVRTPSSSEEEGNILESDLKELLNWPDDLGRTALSLAAMKGFEDVVTVSFGFLQRQSELCC